MLRISILIKNERIIIRKLDMKEVIMEVILRLIIVINVMCVKCMLIFNCVEIFMVILINSIKILIKIKLKLNFVYKD